MRPATLAAAIGGLALLTYFQFPGHTWLQQDSQIYAAILEHQRDPLTLRNDIVAQHPHVAFTLYDEAAQLLQTLSGQSLHTVLAFEQIVTRALGIWGLYLMATALGLSAIPALTAAAICYALWGRALPARPYSHSNTNRRRALSPFRYCFWRSG